MFCLQARRGLDRLDAATEMINKRGKERYLRVWSLQI